jgi:hypothetical protein
MRRHSSIFVHIGSSNCLFGVVEQVHGNILRRYCIMMKLEENAGIAQVREWVVWVWWEVED